MFGLFKKKTKTLKVFISSSFHESFTLGFQKERESLKQRINNDFGDIVDISLDYNEADAETGPLEKSLAKVREADIIIFFIGSRYGTIREDGKSLTHLEFLEAKKQKKPTLVYIFPINEQYEDYDKIRQFIDDIEKSESTIAVYVENKYTDKQDIMLAKKGLKDIQHVDNELLESYCEKLRNDIVEDILKNRPKSHIEKHYKKYIIGFFIFALFMTTLFYYFGRTDVIDKLTYSEQLKKELKAVNYQIRHTDNDAEKASLLEQKRLLEDKLERIDIAKKIDTRGEIVKVLVQSGEKAAYEKIKTKEYEADMEDDEVALAKKQFLRAILAFENQDFDESNKYCKKAMANFPSYSYNIYCASILYLQNRGYEKEQKRILLDTLKLKSLSDENRAHVYKNLATTNTKHYKSYFEKALDLYKETNTTQYYETLLNYAEALLNHFDNDLNDIIKELDTYASKEESADFLFEYWLFKARYYHNHNEGAKALDAIKKTDMYQKKATIDNVALFDRFLKLKTFIFEEQNEYRGLEKIYLDRLEHIKKEAKKLPVLLVEVSDAYSSIISFYDAMYDFKTMEKYFVQWADYTRKVLPVHLGQVHRLKDELCLYYRIFLTVNHNLAKARMVSEKCGFGASLDTNKTKFEKTNTFKNNTLFQELPNTRFKGIEYAIKPVLTDEQEIEVKHTIDFTIHKIETNKSIGCFGAGYSPIACVEFKVLDMNTVAENYRKLGIYGKMLQWYKKAYETLLPLYEQNPQKYGGKMLDQLYHLAMWNDKQKRKAYWYKVETILEELMQKNRDKYLVHYFVLKGNICQKGSESYFKEAEQACSDALNALNELEERSLSNFIENKRLLYAYMIQLENWKQPLDLQKKEKYKTIRRALRTKLKKIKQDTSGRSFHLILSYIDEINRKIEEHQKTTMKKEMP